MSLNVDPAKLRKPNIRFSLDPIFNREKSQKEKREVWDDIEHVHITFPGNTQTELVAPATDIAGWSEGMGDDRRELTYAEKFNAEYIAFKEGRADELGGTPIDQLDIPEGKKRELKALHVKTIEQLASLDGAHLKRIGMGGGELKERAIRYVEAHQTEGSTDALLAQLNALQDVVRQQAAQLAAFQATVTEGQARTAEAVAAKAATGEGALLGSGGVAVTGDTTGHRTVPGVVDGDSSSDPNDPPHDPLDHDQDGGKGGSLPDELKEVEAQFEGFSDEDIGNWLTDAEVKVDGRWGHRRLLEEAKAVLDAKGKKKHK